jgi:hypothetical protein
MVSRAFQILAFSSLLIAVTSCGTSHHSRGPKEYIEKHGLHSDKKPHELASELGTQGRAQKRAYRRQLFKSWKKAHPGERRRNNPYR